MRLSALRFVAAAFLGFRFTAAGPVAETITFSADSVESVLAKGKERTVLSGRANVKTGSITISADRIELFGKDYSFLDCSGNVRVKDVEKEIRLQAPKLYYDRTRKLTRAQGPSILEDDKNKMVLKAEWIENDGDTEIMLAQVAVRILKENLACRAEYAVFRRKDKALELSGSPSANKEGDEYRATRILVNTDTEEIRLEGEVKGTVRGKSGASGGEKAAPGEKPPAAASPGGGSPGPKPSSGDTTVGGATISPGSPAAIPDIRGGPPPASATVPGLPDIRGGPPAEESP